MFSLRLVLPGLYLATILAAPIKVQLAAKNAGECGGHFSSYFWIPRSQLAPLGMPNKTCGSSPLGGCGSVTINGKSYDLNQINVADGHDVCKVCNCDLAYINLAEGNHLVDVSCGDTVTMSYSPNSTWTTLPDKSLRCSGAEFRGDTGAKEEAKDCLAAAEARADVNYAVWQTDKHCYVCALTDRGPPSNWPLSPQKGATSFTSTRSPYPPPPPPPTPPPPPNAGNVTDITKNASNIFGRAYPRVDSGVVKYLGNMTSVEACAASCLAYYQGGELCHSFTYNTRLPGPGVDYQGSCYGITDHTWELRDGSCPSVPDSCLTSGKISRHGDSVSCGVGCTWVVDPVCVEVGREGVLRVINATVDEATAQCAADSTCYGFFYPNTTTTTPSPRLITLVNVTTMARDNVNPGASACWTHRKFFHSTHEGGDPFRTTLHFQPAYGWMNDPNGPMYFNGLYHLFYQWNPLRNFPVESGGFGDMHWGHATSQDLLAWTHLPVALVPDGGSCGGEWSGSATLEAPETAGGKGGPVLSYSVQCNSYYGQATLQTDPKTDPLLQNWTANHVVGHKAPGTGGFRDPSTAWKGSDGVWRQLLACNGASCLYTSSDFQQWQYAGHAAGTGKGATWEMPDIEPIPGSSLLFYKVGMENGTSYWTTGTFDEKTNTFVVAEGVGALGDPTQRADYGEFYSSKTFTGSPLGLTLIGWIGEEGGPMKEWAGIQSIPRIITLDPEHRGRVVFNPLPALTSLRIKQGSVSWTKQPLSPSTSVSLKGIKAPLVDISVDFEGPFTLGTRFGVRLAQYEYPTATDGVTVSIVVDQSSPEGWAVLDVDGRNGTFPLPNNNAPLHLRVLIDTSVVEAFAGNGRAVVTRRFYRGPDERSVSVFNDGKQTVVVDLEAYELERPEELGMDALREVAERSMVEASEVVMDF